MTNIIVQLDGDPLKRHDKRGRIRFQLNAHERKELKRRELMHKIAAKFIEGMSAEQIAKQFDVPLITVTKVMMDTEDTKSIYFNRIIDRVLSIEQGVTRSQIAKDLGISPSLLTRMMNSDEFKELYSAKFIELRSDPNIDVSRQYIVQDLLPLAMHQLRRELTENDIPWTVRQKARQDVFKLAGLGASEYQRDDRAEALKFLEDHDVTIDVHAKKKSIEVPEEYRAAVKEMIPSIEAEYKLVDEDKE